MLPDKTPAFAKSILFKDPDAITKYPPPAWPVTAPEATIPLTTDCVASNPEPIPAAPTAPAIPMPLYPLLLPLLLPHHLWHPLLLTQHRLYPSKRPLRVWHRLKDNDPDRMLRHDRMRG